MRYWILSSSIVKPLNSGILALSVLKVSIPWKKSAQNSVFTKNGLKNTCLIAIK